MAGEQMPSCIANLDLDKVGKVARKTYSMTTAHIEKAEEEYRLFLWACKAWHDAGHEERFAGLSKGADQMWHCHMMLPVKYLEDCVEIFGARHVLDHDPFFSEKDMGLAREQTRRAYQKIGKPSPPDPIDDCQWALVVVLALVAA